MKECLYFPAIVCADYDSPVDALTGLHVAIGDAMDAVVAAWGQGSGCSILAEVDGGRHVAAIPLQNGRWAGCNAFIELASPSPSEAARRLAKILKRGRRGLVGRVG